MTYTRRAIFQVLFIAVAAGCAALAAVDGTPEQALLDIVTTSKPEVVEDHLPVVTVDAIRHLAAPDRQAAEKAILSERNCENKDCSRVLWMTAAPWWSSGEKELRGTAWR